MQPQKLVEDIIKEQSLIIGEQLAKSRAEDSGAVKFKSSKINDFTIQQENTSKVIEILIEAYEEIFGQASVEVCLDVMKKYPIAEMGIVLPEHIKLSTLVK